jgi:hypothetical protein
VMVYVTKFTEYFAYMGFKEPEKEAIFMGAILDGVSLNYIYNKEAFPREYIQNRLYELFKVKS